jgi:hypothetical protein
MKTEEMCAELDMDLETAISDTTAYARQLVESEKSASHLAERLNGELPPRFEDLRRSFVANLESRLGDLGEEFVRGLDAKIRIIYYDTEIERAVTKGISCSSWSDWHPDLAPKIQTAAGGCAVLAGMGTGLSLAKAFGILPIKLPIIFGSPAAAVLCCLALTCAASAVAMRPDALPCVLDHERKQAQNHLDAHLATLRQELAQAARRAAEASLAELEKLKTSHDSSSPSR